MTATRDATPRKIFFTIVAWNYIAYAATLMQSVAAAHPDSLRAIIICDVRAELGATLSAEILYADQIGIDDVASMAFGYGVMEFATAVKPSAFLHFLRAHPDAHVVYLDPDIQLAAPLVHVFAALATGAGLVLTPHMTRPLQDGFQPDDLTIMKSGVHNLGFLAARAEPETLGFLRWWADRCRRDAIVDIPNHKFTDQRWVDLAPCFVGATHLLRHPGYNIAYWNLSERRVARRGRTHTVNGEKIHFLHFSGVVPADPTILSKHQDRFELTDLPDYAELHGAYINALLAQGWRETTQIRYGFDRFADGRKIHRCMRASFRRHEGRDAFDGAAAFASDGAMFDADEPSLARSGPPGITRVMHELREERIDLRRAFATDDAAGRAAYLDWFVSGGGAEAGFDAASLAGAGRLREAAAPAPAEAARPRATLAPWDPQSTLIHDGPPGELEAWLRAPTPIKLLSGGGVHIPRLLALLWEARADLRQHFALQSAAELEAYLAWCVTRGVREGAAPIDLLGPRLGPYLDAAEGERDPARAPDRPPRTRLLRLVGHAYRGAFADIPDHDRDDRALLARTLWLCGAMRDQHDWPIEMVARPTAWLRAPSALRCGSFAAPNIVEACYRLRRDVQDAFDAATETGVWRVVAWFVVFGSREFSLAPELCGPAFLDWLRAPAEAVDAPTELTNLDRLVWLARPDVTASFRIDQPAGRAGLRRWMRDDAPRDPGIRPWLAACAPASPPPETAPNALRCDICLTGLWGAASGRGEDVRLTAAALRAQNIDFVVFDRRTETFFDAAGAPAEIDTSSIRVNIVHLNADTALWDYLAMRRAGLTGAHLIGYWAWELERLPEHWNFAFGLYREIWASTRFAAGAFARGGRPVHLMPMAVDLPDAPSALTRADFGLAADEFVFYYGFDYRSYMARKNPEAAIAGFLQAFAGGADKVRLVIKTLAADERTAERNRIAALAADDPRIMLIDGEMNRADLFALIGSCDCYVSPHRSEGFGRGPAEAMLLGLPVIATGYSGNMDFTTTNTAFVIDYTLVPVESGAYPGGDKQMWAEIDGAKLAAAMRLVMDNPMRRRAVAMAGQRMMREKFSVEAVGMRYADQIVLPSLSSAAAQASLEHS